MKSTRLYAVMLHPNAPKELLEMLKKYVQIHTPVSFLISSSVEPLGHFLELEILGTGGMEPWKIQIPVSYVLAIAEAIKDKEKMRPGFLQGQKEQ